ncbi:MAG: GGDEF domain-containing protein [Lachnospiraceae bacterium]|nr:GGDEF domain-containing protein [Lachnospiraceae bacterium]
MTLRLNDAYERDVSRLFYPVLISIALLLVIDNMDYQLTVIKYGNLFHAIVVFLGYNLRIRILVRLMEIAMRDRKVYRTNFLGDWRKMILQVPFLVAFFITVTSFFSQWVFWYDEDGAFRRGPLSYTPHIVSIIYGLIIIVYSIRIWVKNRRVSEAVILIITTILAVGATAIETVFGVWGILVSFMSLATVFYYLCIHTEYFKYDLLTGAFNRTIFKADLKKARSKGRCAVLSIDLNDLKKINDNKGHLAGDEALKKTADIIVSSIDPGCTLYRTGGDEFTVIARGVEEKDVEDMIAKMRLEMIGTDYTFAIGYSMWEREESFNDAYSKADKKMYENKAAMKNGRKTR